MATLADWQPYDSYVQSGMTDGRFQNAAYTLLSAGPPRLAGAAALTAEAGGVAAGLGAAIAQPMGLIQSFTMSHNSNIQRVFELGSQRSYFIPGRTMGQLQLGRIMYHGMSLLRVMYAYYQDLLPPTVIEPAFPNIGIPTSGRLHDVKVPPGYGNVFLNLASDLFMQPMGILMMMKDNDEQTLGAGYFEACYIPNHTLSTDAMGTIIQEQAAVQFERMVPVATTVIGLITEENGFLAEGPLPA